MLLLLYGQWDNCIREVSVRIGSTVLDIEITFTNRCWRVPRSINTLKELCALQGKAVVAPELNRAMMLIVITKYRTIDRWNWWRTRS